MKSRSFLMAVLIARFIVAVAVLFGGAAKGLAQQPTGAIEGRVSDPNGAVISGATVSVREIATNQKHTAVTRNDGKYFLQQLSPGIYEIKVTQQGFKSTVVSNIKVDVGKTAAADVEMQIGATNDELTIVGSGEAQIDRLDHTVSGVVGTLQIANLPLNGRNFLDLARLQPGAETVDGATFDPIKANYTGVSIAGQAGRSTQITVDGGSVVDNVVGTTTQNFSQEIIQEFQVGLSTFDLSTGATASGSVNVVTKSGSNDYHGNGFIYWRDSRFASFPSLKRLVASEGIPAAAQASEIPFDREQFGGTLGGPLKKDKLFFFTSFEYNNQDAVAIHALSPTLASFSGFTANPFDESLATGKLDWIVSDKMTLAGRYSHNHNDQRTPFPLGTGIVPRVSSSGIFQSEDQLITNRSDGFVISATRAIRPTLTNTLIYNFNDFHNQIDAVTQNFPNIRVINPDQNWRSGTSYLTPQITNQNRNQIRNDLAWTLTKHNIRLGGDWERTSITGVFDFAKPIVIRIYGPGSLGSSKPLLTEDDFLNSPVRDISLGIGSGVVPFNTSEGATVNHRFQVYVADNWKLTPRFTFNYGLAYRIDTNLWNHDLPKPAVIAPLFTKGTAASARDTNNIAPRVGFAWDLKGSGKTVIRGGFGMYYDTTIDNLRLFERADLGKPGAELFLVGSDIASTLLPGGDGLFASSPTSSGGYITLRQMLALYPQVRKDVESRAFNCTKPTSVECFGAISGPLFSSTFQVPYSLQYSIGLQRELPWKMVLQADFNYRKGVHEILTYDANFVDSVDKNGNGTQVLKNFNSSVAYADSSAFSVYKALLLRVDRRFTDGFQMTASYALSRLESFGGDALGLGQAISDRSNFRKEFGPGGLDRTHRLVVSGLYELPFFKNSPNKAAKYAFGDWQVSLISTAFSGLPLTPILPDFVDLSGTGAFFSYLPGVGVGQVGRGIRSLGELNAAIRAYNQNRKQYAAMAIGSFLVDPYGTELRELAELPAGTYIGGDSLVSQDVRLTKRFRFTEKKSLDFIAEVFNLFNVANLTGISDTVIPAKEDTLKPGYQFTAFRPTQRTTNLFGTGGPRAFQFALKFSF